MLPWIKNLFNLNPQEQLEEIISNEPSLEERLERLVSKTKGGFKGKGDQELDEIIDDLEVVLDIIDKIISALDSYAGTERAKKLRTRLKKQKSWAIKAKKSA